MAKMIPNDALESLRSYTPPPPPSRFSQIPWGSLCAVVLLVGLGGWAWYHFEWTRRLPQPHSLTDKQGQTQQVQLTARNDSVLQYTLPADNTVHYVAIAALAEADQEFIKSLPSSLALNYPFECLLGEPNAQPALLRIEGHNDDWVRYVRLSDHTTHYSPLRSFSSEDQTILKQLPNAISITLPVTRDWTDTAGKPLPGTIEGRSYDSVKLTSPDGLVFFIPIHDLSALDQSLVRLMSSGLGTGFPQECTLTDKNGKHLSVRLEGRSATSVKYTLLSDGSTYYVPLTDFSIRDRTFIRTLPSNLDFNLPLNYTLVDTKGRSIHARIEARSDSLVKFTDLDSGFVYYWPLRALSRDTQDFIKLLPMGLLLNLPLDATLTSQAGQDLPAHILGRDSTTVRFSSADGKTYTYQLAKLSQESQDFLQMVNPDPSANLNTFRPPGETQGQFELLRGQLLTLMQSDSQIGLGLDRNTAPGLGNFGNTSSSTRGNGYAQATATGSVFSTSGSYTDSNSRTSAQLRVDDVRNQIEIVCKQLNPLLDLSAKQGKAQLAVAAWKNVMRIVRDDDQLRQDIASASPTFRAVKLDELRKNQADLVSALNQINGFIGAYTPSAASVPAATP